MDPKNRFQLLQRRPSRISASFPAAVSDWLFEEAAWQGRSVSSLISHICESAMRGQKGNGNGHQERR
jgi:hypothetical protein